MYWQLPARVPPPTNEAFQFTYQNLRENKEFVLEAPGQKMAKDYLGLFGCKTYEWEKEEVYSIVICKSGQ